MITEKLEMDMLKWINSKQERRLTESDTKFVIYQIFKALKKLHKNKIAHCIMFLFNFKLL